MYNAVDVLFRVGGTAAASPAALRIEQTQDCMTMTFGA
jgi:hypothetical protein